MNDIHRPFIKRVFRLVTALPFLVRVLPLCIPLILISSLMPALFRVYLGWLAECSDGTACEKHLLGHSLTISVYGIVVIALGATLLRMLSWMAFELSGQWASHALHRKAVMVLGKAATSFFNERSAGSIVSRLVTDFYAVSLLAVIRISDSIGVIFDLLAVSLVVGYGSPLCSLLLLPVVYLVIKIQKRDMKLIYDARNAASVAHGDFVAKLPDLFEGREEYLRYEKRSVLVKIIRDAHDRYCTAERAAGSIEAKNRLKIQSIAEIYGVLVVTILAVALTAGTLDTVGAAVVLSVVFGMSSSFMMLTMATSSMEDSLATSDRLLSLVSLLREEEEEGSPMKEVSGTLGRTGSIELVNFTASYSDDGPSVLKQLSATFPVGKRIGIIGRTGSGKSTLIQVLTRMVKVRKGDVGIGDLSIYDKDAAYTRSLFSVVPQVPYLFPGTLRENLDMTGTTDSAKLEEMLMQVGLSYPLDTMLEDGGAPLSMGERQLVCIARAALSQRPYVLLDEPTSLLDEDLDCRVQNLVKKLFTGRTVICVAHRLKSIADYDYVLWLERGELKEVGEPNYVFERFNSVQSELGSSN